MLEQSILTMRRQRKRALLRKRTCADRHELLAKTIYLAVGGPVERIRKNTLPLNFSRHRKNNPQIEKSYRAKKITLDTTRVKFRWNLF